MESGVEDVHTHIYIYTLWLFNIAMENGHFIDGLPINSIGGSFHGELLVITRGWKFFGG